MTHLHRSDGNGSYSVGDAFLLDWLDLCRFVVRWCDSSKAGMDSGHGVESLKMTCMLCSQSGRVNKFQIFTVQTAMVRTPEKRFDICSVTL